MIADDGASASKDEQAPHDATDGRVRTMTKEKGPKTAQRRDFLKLAGLGTLAGAAAAAGGTPGKAEAATAKTSTGAGYRETEHVKTAYKLSRF